MTELASPQRPSTEPPSPRSPGTSVQEYLDNDARPVPAVLRYDINEDLGTAPLDVERYISREFHDREVEKVWRKVWQFACREDHIPNPGDHVTYDIADDKLIIMRQPDGTIKALYNVCLHRGRALRQEGGTGQRAALPVPRLLLEHRRHDEEPALRLGLPRDRSRRTSRFPRPRSPPGTGSSSSTRTPTPSRSRTSSARC